MFFIGIFQYNSTIEYTMVYCLIIIDIISLHMTIMVDADYPFLFQIVFMWGEFVGHYLGQGNLLMTFCHLNRHVNK